MEIEQKYSEADQAILDKAHKVIAHHSELLIREILKSSTSGLWDQECELIYRKDIVREKLINDLCDIHSRMMPEIIIKF